MRIELKDEPKVSFPDIPKSPKKEERRRPDESREPKVPDSTRTGGIGASGESGHGGSRRTPRFPSSGGSKGFSRKSFPDSSRKVRPSQFQKWVKKYNGSADPYDHLATFRQVVRAEQITDLHTQVEGFGLMLEGKALLWFQTLEPDTFEDFEALENDFIAAFSKMGIKHNIVALIYGFVQKENKFVRDCANWL